MPDPEPPSDVRDLVRRRAAAREVRDWPAADALRDQLMTLGWQVEDRAAGPIVRPILVSPGASQAPDARALPSRLGDPPTVAASVQVLAEDDAADLGRFLAGMAAHPPATTWELVVVANAPSESLDRSLEASAPTIPATVLRLAARLGWADARTLGMRQSSGEVTVLVDTSVEPVGDFVAPLLEAFRDASVGIAGPWGVTSADGRRFEAAAPGEVDAVEGHCLAVRREALRAVGGFDPRFRYYRNADLDFGFAVRDAGWRAVQTDALPLVRHEHRGYAALPPEERDRLSKRNFYRFLKHWGDRRDLLTRRR